MIELVDFSCGYKDRYILKDLNYTFKKGITGILGASGRGKSTLLLAMAKLHIDNNFIFKGAIRAKIEDKIVDIYNSPIDDSKIRREILYIFQNPIIFPISIYENLAFPLKLQRKKENIDIKIKDVLKRVNLWNKLKNRLNSFALELSQGEKQRLAIARALLLDPSIFLFDEPTSSLDSYSAQIIDELIIELSKDKSIVVVSHKEKELNFLTSNIITL